MQTVSTSVALLVTGRNARQQAQNTTAITPATDALPAASWVGIGIISFQHVYDVMLTRL